MISLSESYTGILGVEITVSTYREYKDPELATQIIGTIGKIYSEEWEELSDKGYSYNDYVDKSGVEKAFESHLKGTDGKLTYYFDKSGNMVKSEITSQPKQGNTVYLTIDSKLQKVSQEILAKHIKKLNSSGSKITGGAVVVTKVDSGEVLASANYPTYSFDDYYNDYSSILSSPNNPLFDRAFRGTYPPGSAFKPLVAIAGLQENIIDRYTTVKCVEKYTYYEDYQPSCMHYHGTMNVISSISKSCNYFFFDCGRQVGITKLNNYSRLFGFGEKTGVETAESSGVLAGPKYSSSVGSIWYDGQTLSAAIGQSDNRFTPMQLCVYTSTLANRGVRYKATFLNRVVSSDYRELEFENQPVVVSSMTLASFIKVSQSVFFGQLPKEYENVKEVPFGMRFAMGILALLCIVTGIFPEFPFLTYGIPAVLSCYFDLFSGFVQAYVFTLLTMVYISGSLPEPETAAAE